MLLPKGKRCKLFVSSFPGVARTPMPKLIHFAPDIADEAMRRGHPTGVQWPDSPWGGPLSDRGATQCQVSLVDKSNSHVALLQWSLT